MNKVPVAVLVSGGGTNLQALMDFEAAGHLRHGRIALVISNRPDAYALERARKAGIPAMGFDGRALGAQALEDSMLSALKEHNIGVVVLAGYLSILSACFVQAYPNRILNVHPALIPAFSGKGYYGLKVHEAALARGVKITGATVHLVNEEADAGPILLQKAVPVQPDDTPETLQRRVMEQAEWVLLPRAVEEICERILKGDYDVRSEHRV